MPKAHLDHIRPPDPEKLHNRLLFFLKELDLDEKSLSRLAPHAQAFADRAPELAELLYRRFDRFAQTKLLLDQESSPGRLKKTWEHWFRGLFLESLSERFVSYLWMSGRRHIVLGIDQRFINLAYGHVRRFCQQAAAEIVPPEERGDVLAVVNALLDFCILVETDSFISGSAKCDHEIAMGIAHQIRNPLTIIGGYANRLTRTEESCMDMATSTEAILTEARRLETMVRHVILYTTLLQTSPEFKPVSLEKAITEALRKLGDERGMDSLPLKLTLDPEVMVVYADEELLGHMLLALFRNSAEALGGDDPAIEISTRPSKTTEGFVELEIFNTGEPPAPERIESYFDPFHSTKPMATGFGLPIARLATRKNLGTLSLEPVAGRGARYLATLPLQGTVHESEYFSGT